MGLAFLSVNTPPSQFSRCDGKQPQTIATAPAPKHEDGDHAQARCEPGPDADSSPVHRECEGNADTQSDRPIAEESEDHRHARVVDAPKHSGADDGKVTPLDVKAGDKILFGKWSGTEVKLDGEELLIMKESDIMGVIS